jgi:hypothetical protein
MAREVFSERRVSVVAVEVERRVMPERLPSDGCSICVAIRAAEVWNAITWQWEVGESVVINAMADSIESGRGQLLTSDGWESEDDSSSS